MVGMDVAETKAELQDQFYKHLSRKTGERVIDWMSRFREHTSNMKAEGIVIDDEELVYMLKEKTRLTPYRREMLDTFLGAGADYGKTEAAIVRLFGKMHENEKPRASERAANVAANEDMMWDVTEREVYDARAEPRDDTDADPVLDELDAVLRELDAEGDGVDAQAAAELETAAGAMAEAYVTMRESKQKMQATRKDRKFGAPAAEGSSSTMSSKGAKGKGKQSFAKGAGKARRSIENRKTRSKCFDCDQT